MNTYNVTYEISGMTDFLLVVAKSAEEAERKAKRICPSASYYYAEDVGE